MLLLLTVVTLAATLFLAYCIWFVPAGPECPQCGQPARPLDPGLESGHAGSNLLRICTVEAWCPGCGWDGRMRRSTGELAWEPSHERNGGPS